MAGLSGLPLSCPFDKRRNGPVLGEAAVVFAIEDLRIAKQRKTPILCRIRSISSCSDGSNADQLNPRGDGMERAIRGALRGTGMLPSQVDYVSCCANSSQDLDRIEVAVLKRTLGKYLKSTPVSSIKSMIGETVSASAALQMASRIGAGAMAKQFVPPIQSTTSKGIKIAILTACPTRDRKRTFVWLWSPPSVPEGTTPRVF
jgi:3-oxoacyl-(acyl-carrier-protein) synthase